MNHAPNRAVLRRVARRALVERGLEPDFPEEALDELRRVTAPAAPPPGARDLRELLWCSIDNDDSRDLDQLTVSEPRPGGATRVMVAVADVDALVPKGSALDGHARTNTTSVYTAAEIFPMLPERLSTDLTSLNQGEDRVALVFAYTVEASGEVRADDGELFVALVHNQAQLAYNAVAAWLDGRAPAPARLHAVPGLEEQVRAQDRVAQAMKALRHRRGSLSLRTIEAHAVFAGDALTDLRPDEENRAKELIEGFMVAANGVVARFLAARRFPCLRRILKPPERWDRIVALAGGYGGRLPPAPDAGALERFLVEARDRDPERFPDLSLAVVKLLGNGEYALQPAGGEAEGHFGLAVKDYAHATAPNRRYPDLVTHRLVKAALAGKPPPYADAELGELARHCTEQEGDAAKVERQVRKSAAALLLLKQIGRRYDAVVTGASPKGTWVRISEPAVEGRVVRGEEGLDVGDRTRVELLRADVEKGFIDFGRVEAR